MRDEWSRSWERCSPLEQFWGMRLLRLAKDHEIPPRVAVAEDWKVDLCYQAAIGARERGNSVRALSKLEEKGLIAYRDGFIYLLDYEPVEKRSADVRPTFDRRSYDVPPTLHPESTPRIPSLPIPTVQDRREEEIKESALTYPVGTVRRRVLDAWNKTHACTVNPDPQKLETVARAVQAQAKAEGVELEALVDRGIRSMRSSDLVKKGKRANFDCFAWKIHDWLEPEVKSIAPPAQRAPLQLVPAPKAEPDEEVDLAEMQRQLASLKSRGSVGGEPSRLGAIFAGAAE